MRRVRKAAAAPPKRPRVRLSFLAALFGVLLVLASLVAVAGWWAHGEAHRRVLDALQSRAQARGWQIEVERVEVDVWGHVTLEGVTARGQHGGRVYIKSLRATVPPEQWLSGPHTPDRIFVSGVHAQINEAELEALQRTRAKNTEPKRASQPPPALFLTDAHVRFESSATGALEGTLHYGALSRSEDVWQLLGRGQTQTPPSPLMDFELNASPARRWGQVAIRFMTSLRYEHERYGVVEAQALNFAGSEDAIHGYVEQIHWVPKESLGPRSVHVERVEVALTREDGRWRPSTLLLVAPRASVHLDDVLNGPLGVRYPQFAQTARQALTRLDLLPNADMSEASANIEPTPSEQAAAALPSDMAHDVRGLIEQIKGVVIEGGSVELILSKRRSLQLVGVDFDTQDLAGQTRRYDVVLSLQGTRAELSLTLPEGEEDWPAGEITLEGLAVERLFALADLPPPPQLKGELDLSLSVARTAEGHLAIDGRVATRDVGFFHPKVSDLPISELNAEVDVQLRYDLANDRLWVEDSAVRSGRFEAKLSVDVEALQSDPMVRFKIWNESLPCDALPTAFPKGVFANVERIQMEGGVMKPLITGSLLVSDPMTFKLELEGIPGDCSVGVIEPFDVSALNHPKFSYTTQYSTLSQGIEVGPGSDHYTPLDALPAYARAVMFITEDIRFFDHGGLRLGQFVRAMRLNLSHNRYLYGGSSLNQQLTKNIFLHRGKTLSRKVEEAFIAWQMADVVEKNRILEMYINCIEFGPDVYGITQAAAFYFDKGATELTPLEASYLASLKTAPRHGGNFYEHGFPRRGRWWHNKQRRVVLSLARTGYISPAEVIASYPWVPEFVYPDPSRSNDWRNRWLKRRKAARRSARRAKRED